VLYFPQKTYNKRCEVHNGPIVENLTTTSYFCISLDKLGYFILLNDIIKANPFFKWYTMEKIAEIQIHRSRNEMRVGPVKH